jgi:3-hydroxyisobutyrate dehydrogenase
MQHTRRVGFAGLGIMGRGMAKNLLTKGFPLTVWNRSPAPAEHLRKAGAAIATSRKALGASAEVVFSCLSDPAAVRQVVLGEDGILAGMAPGSRLIDCSTIGAAASLELERAAEARGIGYLEAPVTGSRNGAEAGTLTAMVGGPAALFTECEAELAAFTAKRLHIGPCPRGQQIKLLGNSIVSFMLEALAENLTVAARLGIDVAKVLDLIGASALRSPFFDFKGAAMQQRNFDTHFALELLHKDQALALRQAAECGVELPGLQAIHLVSSVGKALGRGQQDMAAQLEALEALSGEPS